MIQSSSKVDFVNVADTIGYTTVIFAAANKLGILFTCDNKQTQEALPISYIAKRYLNNINSRIANIHLHGKGLRNCHSKINR